MMTGSRFHINFKALRVVSLGLFLSLLAGCGQRQPLTPPPVGQNVQVLETTNPLGNRVETQLPAPEVGFARELTIKKFEQTTGELEIEIRYRFDRGTEWITTTLAGQLPVGQANQDLGTTTLRHVRGTTETVRFASNVTCSPLPSCSRMFVMNISFATASGRRHVQFNLLEWIQREERDTSPTIRIDRQGGGRTQTSPPPSPVITAPAPPSPAPIVSTLTPLPPPAPRPTPPPPRPTPAPQVRQAPAQAVVPAVGQPPVAPSTRADEPVPAPTEEEAETDEVEGVIYYPNTTLGLDESTADQATDANSGSAAGEADQVGQDLPATTGRMGELMTLLRRSNFDFTVGIPQGDPRSRNPGTIYSGNLHMINGFPKVFTNDRPTFERCSALQFLAPSTGVADYWGSAISIFMVHLLCPGRSNPDTAGRWLEGFTAERLVITSVSQPQGGGGRANGHSTHSTGTDIDYEYFSRTSANVAYSRADRGNLFRLLRGYYRSGILNFVLADRQVKKNLCTWARSADVRTELFGNAEKARESNAVLRRVVHASSHRSHFHVTIKCLPVQDSRWTDCQELNLSDSQLNANMCGALGLPVPD